MDFSLAVLSLSCLLGIVSAQFGLPPFNNRPDNAQFMPRYSAGSGNNNYNNYNGANNGPDNGDSLAQLGLGGLSGFYSALTNELQYAGNSLGAPTTPGPSSGSTVKVADTTVEPYVEASTVKYTTKAAAESNNNYGNNNNNYGNGNPQFGGAPNFGNGGGYGGPSPFTGQAGPGFGGPSPFGPQGGPGGYGDQSPYGGQGGYGGGPFGGPNNGPYGGGPNNGPYGGGPNNGPYGGGPNNGPYGGGPNNGPADNGPAPTGPVNLGDTSVLKKMGLEQLGTFFGSMVSELNNAGAQVGGPVVPDAHTTPKSIVPAQAVTVAATTASS
ncbi:hypothetical protein BV898_03452 [Hypsibius exemplaris]|uniref:Uncharacterized protein n=1 Tax=Hypsibius exemplaris TaxID=2072580 RepID=A0A1W0X4Y0_HYPEX|nr:hypothetical protein BV898_03452 [Hypsibius exemplaris]